MPFNYQSFCSEPWSQLEIDTQGNFKMCCLANAGKDYGMSLDSDGHVMNVMTHSFQEGVNSETHKSHRIMLRNNEKPERCNSCYLSEAAGPGAMSKRQRVIGQTVREIPEYVNVRTADEFTAEDGTSTARVVNLDLRLGNLCNYQCIMCSPEFSSLWKTDWEDMKAEPHRLKSADKYLLNDPPKWWETEVWWNKFDAISPELRYIYFTGGEPLLVQAMEECLTRLISGGHAKDIILRYDTNLSALNRRVIDKWKHFRRVDLCVSVDEVGDRYHIIRNPGNFERFDKNLRTVIAEGFTVEIMTSCIGLATIYSIPRVSDYADSLGIQAGFRYLFGPVWLDIRILPQSAKLEVIDKLNQVTGSSRLRSFIDAEIKVLENSMDMHHPDRIESFVRIMDRLDTSRGTNWRTTLDDVYDLLSRHCPDAFVE